MVEITLEGRFKFKVQGGLKEKNKASLLLGFDSFKKEEIAIKLYGGKAKKSNKVNTSTF